MLWFPLTFLVISRKQCSPLPHFVYTWTCFSTTYQTAFIYSFWYYSGTIELICLSFLHQNKKYMFHDSNSPAKIRMYTVLWFTDNNTRYFEYQKFWIHKERRIWMGQLQQMSTRTRRVSRESFVTSIKALNLVNFVPTVNSASLFKKEFPKAFQGLGISGRPYEITVEENAKSHAITAPRRVPLPLSGKLNIQSDHHDWGAPIVVVLKPDGNVCLCVDLTKSNWIWVSMQAASTSFRRSCSLSDWVSLCVFQARCKFQFLANTLIGGIHKAYKASSCQMAGIFSTVFHLEFAVPCGIPKMHIPGSRRSSRNSLYDGWFSGA